MIYRLKKKKIHEGYLEKQNKKTKTWKLIKYIFGEITKENLEKKKKKKKKKKKTKDSFGE